MTDTNQLDYSTLYKDVETQGNVPCVSTTVIDAEHAVYQGMYLDLGEIKSGIAQAGYDPPVVTVIADVLNVPGGQTWLLQDAALVIQVRRLQIIDHLDVALDFRDGTSASLVLYCDELSGCVRATALTGSGNPTTFDVSSPPAEGGVQLSLVKGAPTMTDRIRAQGVTLAPAAPFGQAMLVEFIFATLLSDAHPALAVKQLSWLKNWSGFNSELLGTFLRSSSLLALMTAQMGAQSNGTEFVPYLTREVYGDLAESFVVQARQYESDYRSIALQKAVTDDFLQLAKTLLANKAAESEYASKLLKQAESNFDNAQAAVSQAAATLAEAQRATMMVKSDFENIGVPEWEREQIVRAVISLGTAVITFAVGIGALLVGDPAGGAAAAEGGIEGAEAAEAAAEAGSEAAKAAQELKKTMEELKKIAEALKKAYELSKVVVTVAGDISSAEKNAARMRAMGVDGDVDITATAAWKVYRLTSDAALKAPLDKGIKFAQDLKLAVDKISVYGQAVAAAQVAAIKAGQRYAAVSLQKQLADQEQQQMQQYVDALTEQEAPPAVLMQQFYRRYLDAKSSLYTALQEYRASYYYWALAPSSVRPKIIDSVEELDTGLKSLTAMRMDTQSALDHFSPPPQKLVDKRFVVQDPQVLQQLAEHGKARWVLPPEAVEFAGLGRVRLSTVRVWLDGARTKSSQGTVSLVLSTQGNYLDRLGGKQFQFTSKPLVRDFEYRVTTAERGTPDWFFEDGSYGYVEVDGTVDTEVSYAYFQPTPFAEWGVRVENPSEVDLSSVTRITMDFAGSVIGSSDVIGSADRSVAAKA